MSAYFDNAATTFPKPESVYQFMDTFYRLHGGNAGRGQYKLAAEASRILSETRGKIQDVLMCPNKYVIFSPSDTLALNTVIRGNMHNGVKTVYISPFEHNSVTRVLHYLEKVDSIHVEVLPLGDDYQYDISLIEHKFNKIPPDMVIVSHVSNVCGLIAPVEEIFGAAKKFNAITITDMAQSAGLVPLNTGSDNVDYAVFSGHKTLYGPFGVAGFVMKKDANLEPVIFGGTGIDSANQNMPDAIPSRYEAGSSNIQAVAGLHAALSWILENQDKIVEKEKVNHEQLLKILNSFPNIRIIGPRNRANCIGVVSCLFDDYSPDNIGNILDELEIAVRTGLECAPVAHKTLGTFPAGTVRFSVGYFTTDRDFDELQKALEYIYDNS